MTKKRFWEIIDASRAGFDPVDIEASREQQFTRLYTLLSALSAEDVQDFDRHFVECMAKAYCQPKQGLWAVAFAIGHGCSYDAFEDFRSWLISMGREAFEKAVLDPKTIYDLVEQEDLGKEVFYKKFRYVSSRVLREKIGEAD